MLRQWYKEIINNWMITCENNGENCLTCANYKGCDGVWCSWIPKEKQDNTNNKEV